MSQSKIQQRSSESAQELGDETFMSASELRNYMVETVMAKASKDAGSGRAEKAREELIKSLMQPVPVTPEKIAEVKRRVLGQEKATKKLWSCVSRMCCARIKGARSIIWKKNGRAP
jgi:hypothetical protein